MIDRLRCRGRSGSRPRAAAADQAQPVHPDQVGQRVVSRCSNVRAGGPHLLGQPVRNVAERPGHPARRGDADRPVPVLHGRVRLGPELGRLAQLERRLVGQPDRPAATQEAHLLGVGAARAAARPRPRPSTARARPPAPRSAPRWARNRARVLVANRVCTTDRSSTSSSSTTRCASSAIGAPAVRRDRGDGRSGAQVAQHLQHLGGGAGAADRQHPVVAAVQGVLAGRVGVGDPVTGLLAQHRVALCHVQRGAAADHRDPLAGPRQRVRAAPDPRRDAQPVVGLGGDLPLEVAVRVEGHDGSGWW